MKLDWVAGNGETMALHNHVDVLVQLLEGTGEAPVTLQMSKAPFQDGQTLIDQVLEPREMTIQLLIKGNDRQELWDKRRKLTRLFNPKLGLGTLRWEQDNGTAYAIKAVCDGGIEYPEGAGQGDRLQTAMIHLLSPDPAWYRPTPEEWVLASFVGGMTLPLQFPVSFGQVGQSVPIHNKGDLATPVRLVFRGPLKNPVLENVTTGQEIRITEQLLAGEYLEIETAFGRKSVWKTDAEGQRFNAFHYVAPDSVFWQLVLGMNEISYSATEESGDAAVTLTFFHRYVGV